MEVEVTAQVGAERGQRAPERRVTHRNGDRPRDWDTRVGTVELEVPKLAMRPVNAAGLTA
jgi:putative transposase